ncbi:hypothetical protein PPUTLS46_008844 [Pseudomonas putida LS46]|nr:hypothetical protein PPUTLS46_008844 [Pseudomonas putida LS46]
MVAPVDYMPVDETFSGLRVAKLILLAVCLSLRPLDGRQQYLITHCRWHAAADSDQVASMVAGNGIKHFLIQESWALTSHFEFVSIECWILFFSRFFTCHSGCQRLETIDATWAVAL